MKKVLTFLAIASLVAVSCGGNKNNPENEVPAGEPAPAIQEANAGTLQFDPNGNDALVIDFEKNNLKGLKITELDFFRGGSYLGKGYPSEPGAKAEIPYVYFSGTFTMENGMYKLFGDAKFTLKIEGNKITATVGGKTVTVNGSFTGSKAPTTTLEKALCVSWKLSSLEAVIASPSFKHKWTGAEACDLKGVAQYINEHSTTKLNEAAFEGYKIESINVNADPKTIAVVFVKDGVEPDPDPIVGNWSNLNIQNGTFKYHLETQLQGKLFKGDAEGKIEFKSNYTQAIVTLDVTSTTNNLSGQVILTLARI